MPRRRKPIELIAVDLFAGCGGLSQGMIDAGFKAKVAVELEPVAARAYKLNHPDTCMLQKDIRTVTAREILELAKSKTIHLLAGCPPCQGFSMVRRLNKKRSVRDNRNNLVLEYFRLVEEIRPLTIMLENVPGLKEYYHFKDIVTGLKELGYHVDFQVVNVKNYRVPQSRQRLVLVGSLLGKLAVAKPRAGRVTVRHAIGKLASPSRTRDPLQKIVSKHNEAVAERIRLTPKDGGSWSDLPARFILKCHKQKNIGFHDIYGRLRWDDYSNTITGGCLNPSKGRFLHPEQDRVITPREAALLQTFPKGYRFPNDVPKQSLALLIGNALPPKFSYFQSLNISKHIQKNAGVTWNS